MVQNSDMAHFILLYIYCCTGNLY